MECFMTAMSRGLLSVSAAEQIHSKPRPCPDPVLIGNEPTSPGLTVLHLERMTCLVDALAADRRHVGVHVFEDGAILRNTRHDGVDETAEDFGSRAVRRVEFAGFEFGFETQRQNCGATVLNDGTGFGGFGSEGGRSAGGGQGWACSTRTLNGGRITGPPVSTPFWMMRSACGDSVSDAAES
jgi:hypothetical protein